VGFIRETGKATAGEGQQSPEASSSLLRWRLGFLWTFNSGLGGLFSLARDSWAFSGELVWLAPLLGEGKQSWEHFAHQPCGRSVRSCISSLGCRNAVYNSLSKMQEWYCSPGSRGVGSGLLTHLP
jgi:hypothetical protein